VRQHMLHGVPCLHAASTLAESMLMYRYSLSVSNHIFGYRRLIQFDGDRSAISGVQQFESEQPAMARFEPSWKAITWCHRPIEPPSCGNVRPQVQAALLDGVA
jgi:hypothetical protein